MTFMDALKPRFVQINQPARLIRFNEGEERNLSVEERVITNKIVEIDRKLSLLRNKNEDYKSRIHKMSRRANASELQPMINRFKTHKENILKQIEVLRKKRIELEKRV